MIAENNAAAAIDWVRTYVWSEEPDFLWNISAEEARDVQKGVALESSDFYIKDINGSLRLRFFPKGTREAGDNESCSVFVWAERSIVAQFALFVNAFLREIDEDEDHKGRVGPFRAGHDRGYNDFCPRPADDGDLVLKVKLLHVEHRPTVGHKVLILDTQYTQEYFFGGIWKEFEICKEVIHAEAGDPNSIQLDFGVF